MAINIRATLLLLVAGLALGHALAILGRQNPVLISSCEVTSCIKAR